MEPGEVVTTGDKRKDWTPPAALVSPAVVVVTELMRRNSELARRVSDLEEDNAHLRERLGDMANRLRMAERRQ